MEEGLPGCFPLAMSPPFVFLATPPPTHAWDSRHQDTLRNQEQKPSSFYDSWACILEDLVAAPILPPEGLSCHSCLGPS